MEKCAPAMGARRVIEVWSRFVWPSRLRPGCGWKERASSRYRSPRFVPALSWRKLVELKQGTGGPASLWNVRSRGRVDDDGRRHLGGDWAKGSAMRCPLDADVTIWQSVSNTPNPIHKVDYQPVRVL